MPDNNNAKHPILIACDKKDWTKVAQIARENKINANNRENYGDALRLAARENELNAVEVLLQAGAPPTWRDNDTLNYAIHHAVLNGNAKMVELLIERGADLTCQNKDKKTPIQLAADNGYWDIVELIAKSKKERTDKKANYGSALHKAAKANELEAVEVLLQAGADFTWRNNDTLDYAIHEAVLNGNPKMLELLLDHGADFADENNEGKTALMLAAESGFTEAVEIFMYRKAFDVMQLPSRGKDIKTLRILADSLHYLLRKDEFEANELQQVVAKITQYQRRCIEKELESLRKQRHIRSFSDPKKAMQLDEVEKLVRCCNAFLRHPEQTMDAGLRSELLALSDGYSVAGQLLKYHYAQQQVSSMVEQIRRELTDVKTEAERARWPGRGWLYALRHKKPKHVKEIVRSIKPLTANSSRSEVLSAYGNVMQKLDAVPDKKKKRPDAASFYARSESMLETAVVMEAASAASSSVPLEGEVVTPGSDHEYPPKIASKQTSSYAALHSLLGTSALAVVAEKKHKPKVKKAEKPEVKTAQLVDLNDNEASLGDKAPILFPPVPDSPLVLENRGDEHVEEKRVAQYS